jgi:hypothetical protein
MTNSNDVIRRIAWRELFPWLILFRTFRISISPVHLLVATAAVLIVPLGWSIGGLVFLSQAQRDVLAAANDTIPRTAHSRLASELPPAPRSYLPLPQISTALLEAYFDLAEPLRRFFLFDLTLREAAYYLFGFLWTLVAWAFPGGAITRRAVVQLATDQPLGIRSAALYAGRNYLWYFLAPLGPLVVVVLLALPIALLGLPLRAFTGLGVALAGLCWLLVAILGFGAVWVLGGLLFGWPLMWPTISAERDGDPFEAFSRSYSYVYGKPLHYFFYVIVAAAFGALGAAVVDAAASIAQEFGFWALSWGAGHEQVTELREQVLDFTAGEGIRDDHGRLWSFGTLLIGLVVGLIHAIALAFRFTFFFTVASAIYLLLRQDVDEKQMDEVYLEPEPAAAGARSETTPVTVPTPPVTAPPAAAGEQP